MDTRRERKKLRTRQALLHSAKILIAKRGIHGTRVEDITERADAGKGVFYNYFPSKNALISELLAEGISIVRAKYLDNLNGTTSLNERVSKIAGLLEAFFLENPMYVILFHQARGLLQTEKQGVEALQQAFNEYLKNVGHLIPPQGDIQNWNEEDLLDAAAVIAGGVSGYRSIRIPADLPPKDSMAAGALSQGVPNILEKRKLGKTG